MNKTERSARKWMVRQGYTNIKFHPNDSPDFTANEGSVEVKLATDPGMKTLRIYSKQFKKLRQANALIALFDRNNPEPFAIIKPGHPMIAVVNSYIVMRVKARTYKRLVGYKRKLEEEASKEASVPVKISFDSVINSLLEGGSEDP